MLAILAFVWRPSVRIPAWAPVRDRLCANRMKSHGGERDRGLFAGGE